MEEFNCPCASWWEEDPDYMEKELTRMDPQRQDSTNQINSQCLIRIRTNSERSNGNGAHHMQPFKRRLDETNTKTTMTFKLGDGRFSLGQGSAKLIQEYSDRIKMLLTVEALLDVKCTTGNIRENIAREVEKAIQICPVPYDTLCESRSLATKLIKSIQRVDHDTLTCGSQHVSNACTKPFTDSKMEKDIPGRSMRLILKGKRKAAPQGNFHQVQQNDRSGDDNNHFDEKDAAGQTDLEGIAVLHLSDEKQTIDDSDRCRHCETVLRLLEKEMIGPFLISIDADMTSVNIPKERPKGSNARKLKREQLVSKIVKYVCALRNSGGGVIVIHFHKKDSDDKYIGFFDELMEERLNDLIEDDTLYTNNYSRRWYGENAAFHDILILNVSSSAVLTTVDYKTKVPWDSGIRRPKMNQMSYFLFGKLTEDPCAKRSRPHHPCFLPVPLTSNASFVLCEDRHTQVKRFETSDIKTETSRTKISTKDIIDHIWKHLKLREYVSCFSKIEGGGQWYCGIEEQRYLSPQYGYFTIRAKITGVDIDKLQQEELEILIRNKINTNTLWLKPNGRLAPAEECQRHVEIHFYNLQDTGRFILRVVVHKFQGLVFFDKKGPDSYRFKEPKPKDKFRSHIKYESDIERIPLATWFQTVAKSM